MKKGITIIVFCLLLFALIDSGNELIRINNSITISKEFQVKIDTISIQIKKLIKPLDKISLTHAVKFNNKYYCFFEGRKINEYEREAKYFFIISNEGVVEESIKPPDKISNSYYFDLFILHDTIFVKAYMHHETYFLDINKLKWKETKEADDVIYEDERFEVTYLDFGEWGYKTWFIDKISGKEYDLTSSGHLINKIDSVYYITSGIKILKIENPLNMELCKAETKYSFVKKQKYYEVESYSILGVKTIYEDTTFSEWNMKEPKVWIATSFIRNNQLLHLCVDSVSTYIAKLENGKLVPIQIIGKNYLTFDWHYSYRARIQKDNNQLLKFKDKNEILFGFIEINGTNINIRYLKLR